MITTTNNMVVVMYPNGCAGKFIINALGLSDGAVFQDYKLSKLQLHGSFSPRDKLDWLLIRLKRSYLKNKWDDLRLGCTELFKIDQFDFYRNSESTIQHISNIINQNKLIFLVVHNKSEEKKAIKQWPGGKIIKITNCHVLKSNYRRCVETKYVLDSFHLPHVRWDANWFFNEDNTVEHIRELYDLYGLSDFNEKYIRIYHKEWLKVIQKIAE